MAVEEGWHAEDALSRRLPGGPDGRLAWNAVFGVLRHRSQVDASLRPFLKKPLASLDAPVRAVLRLAAFEKLFTRTPPHAVVQQAVEVARKVGAGRASGLVNAVTRRVRAPKNLQRYEQLDHPAWLIARWDERFGTERTDAWCERNRTVPPVCLVGRSEDDLRTLELEGLQAELEGQPLANTAVVRAARDLPGVKDGPLWVMDPASVRVADLMVEAVGEGRVLDACASPGGKSFRMAARGLEVLATDLPERLVRLQSNIERLGFDIAIADHDWSAPSDDLGTFAGVLVDAPCTGLGTIRRHPEIRWRRKPTDFADVAARQLTILTNASKHVASEGVLTYAVCSPAPEEGLEVVEKFLEQHPQFEMTTSWTSAPPSGEEDAHQAFVMRRA